MTIFRQAIFFLYFHIHCKMGKTVLGLCSAFASGSVAVFRKGTGKMGSLPFREVLAH
jgi:hypothetical protein